MSSGSADRAMDGTADGTADGAADRAADRTYSISIGEAARRFGVAISTLRWWEKRGLLTPASRQSGRRRYGQAELRRVALIQLCQSTAMMSLEEIGALLAGSTRDGDWRAAVRQRVAACDDQLARLTAARAYLSHMLECPSDHPADTCPYLAEHIDQHLAAGPAPAKGRDHRDGD
ncbi:MerR family transcriptional regulator [Actinomadura sp. 6N118]|uniref:MerR family transcriptional regulator n=1 Tax=Actinomadura sp. 6N118 TaxID=3375151 RepID=UPI00378E1ED7